VRRGGEKKKGRTPLSMKGRHVAKESTVDHNVRRKGTEEKRETGASNNNCGLPERDRAPAASR